MSAAETENTLRARSLPVSLPQGEDWVAPAYQDLSIANLPATIATLLGVDLPGALPALPPHVWQGWGTRPAPNCASHPGRTGLPPSPQAMGRRRRATSERSCFGRHLSPSHFGLPIDHRRRPDELADRGRSRHSRVARVGDVSTRSGHGSQWSAAVPHLVPAPRPVARLGAEAGDAGLDADSRHALERSRNPDGCPGIPPVRRLWLQPDALPRRGTDVGPLPRQ